MTTNLVLIVLRIFVSTNSYHIPGDIAVPDKVILKPDGSFSGLAKGERDFTVVATNYVIGYIQGTNQIELLTLRKTQDSSSMGLDL